MERLALLGGKPVRETPFLTWPSYQSDEEAEAVLAVLRSDHLCAAAGGETILRLEAEFASWCGAAGAVACNSGSSAHHVALAAVRESGRGAGRERWVRT